MLQLIYISRAAKGVSNEDVKAILETSIAWNGAHDVTGLLVFDGRWFMQALEGPAEHVTALYHRIEQDWRNSDVRIVSQHPIDERAFGSWAMAWNPVEAVGAGEPIDEIVAALVAEVEDDDIRAAFLRFTGVAAAAQDLSEPSRKLQ
jgi:hypothetical protein